MNLNDFNITSFGKICRLSFLNDQDCINVNPMMYEWKAKNKDLDFDIVGPNLTDLVKISSPRSGIILEPSMLFELSAFLAVAIFKQSEKNKFLKIKNNKLKFFVYSVTETIEQQKVFYVWCFETSLVTKSRKQWSLENDLVDRACCIRNGLVLHNENSSIDLKNIEKLCCFPNSFVDVNVFFSSYLLYSPIENEKLEINYELIYTDNFLKLQFPYSTKFLTGAPLKRLLDSDDLNQIRKNLETENLNVNFEKFFKIYTKPKQELSGIVSDILEKLGDNSVKNFNCKDLLTNLTVGENNFEDFLFNSILTLYSAQRTILSYDDPAKLNLTIKFLCCDVLF